MDKMKIEEMELYTVDECAELLKCSGKTIRRLLEKKKLQAFDIGAGERKIYRIPAEELERFLKNTANSK
jgi:excisionase family DNA binding protein